MCTMGDEVNPCVARRRSKGVSVAYGSADATATYYLLLQKIHIVFTILIPAHLDSPVQTAVKWKLLYLFVVS